MSEYRKKPVVIDAVQFVGKSLNLKDGTYFPVQVVMGNACLLIDTKEGKMQANVGDWIITGVKGEHYPCKPDIFAATYEAVA